MSSPEWKARRLLEAASSILASVEEGKIAATKSSAQAARGYVRETLAILDQGEPVQELPDPSDPGAFAFADLARRVQKLERVVVKIREDVPLGRAGQKPDAERLDSAVRGVIQRLHAVERDLRLKAWTSRVAQLADRLTRLEESVGELRQLLQRAALGGGAA